MPTPKAHGESDLLSAAQDSSQTSQSYSAAGETPSKFQKMAPRSRTLSVIIADKAQSVTKMASSVNLAMDDDDLIDEANPRGSVVMIEAPTDEETGTELLQRAVSDDQNTGAVHVAGAVGSSAGMDSNTLMRVTLEDEWQMVSCASLPFTILFFIVFMCFFQRHYGITDIFLAETPIRERLGIPAIRIQEAYEVYDYLESSYLPFIWGAKSDRFLEDRLRSQSLYQEAIGGVRFTMSEGKIEPCDDYDNMDCHGTYVNAEGGDLFQRRLASGDFSSSPQAQHPSTTNTSSREQRPGDSEDVLIGERPVSARWAAWRAKKRDPAVGRQSSPAFKRRLADKGYKRPRRVRGVFAEAMSKPAPSKKWPVQKMVEHEDRRLRFSRPEIRSVSPKVEIGNQSQVVFPINMALSNVIDEVQRWKSKQILNQRTLAFRAEVLLVNTHLSDRELMTSVVIEFGFHRGGLVLTDVQVITLNLTALSSDSIQAFLAMLWVFGLILFSFMLFSRAYVRYAQGRLESHMKRFWNWVEWLCIVIGWFTLVLFAGERAMVWGVRDEIQKYKQNVQNLRPWERGPVDIAAVHDIREKAATACNVSMWVQLVVALFHVVIAFRFFLATRGQPRLAIVLNTIRKATSDLMHLLCVFLIIFLGYAVSGNFLFGRRMHEFSTFSGSFGRCFQIVMEREYPWARFTEEDQWTATLWVWTFLVLIVLVLVNIFLAMLFDTYGEARSSVGHSATLWQTMKIVWEHSQRLLRCKPAKYGYKWVANREIIQAVKTMQSDVVTPWMIMDSFPGISNRQVNYLFNLAKTRFETCLIRNSKSSLPAVIASILLGVERMYDKIMGILETLDIDENDTDAPQKEVSNHASFGEDKRLGEVKSPKSGSARRRKQSRDTKQPRIEELPPNWQKIQLMPHIRKQQIMLSQVHSQMKRIRQLQHLSGQDEGLPRAPISQLMPLQSVGAVSHHKDHHPLGPSSASLHVVPAAARSGMTQPSAPNGSQQNRQLEMHNHADTTPLIDSAPAHGA